MPEIRCTLTEEEYKEVCDYVAQKKRWHKMGHFIRDAVYQMIARNPTERRGAVLHEGIGGKNQGVSDG